MKVCRKCLQDKPDAKFYPNRHVCCDCLVERNRERKNERQSISDHLKKWRRVEL